MSAGAPDYYEILGVSKDADEKAIKKAFRKLAQKHHPDAGGDEEKFKEINEAYEVLSNPEKRKVYDQFGSMGGAAGFNGQNPFAGAYGQNPFGGAGATRVNINGMNFDIGDLFNGASGWSEILERMRGGEGAFGTDWDFKSNGGQGFGRGPRSPFGRRNSRNSQYATNFGEMPREDLDSKAELHIGVTEAICGCKKTFTVNTPGKSKPETITLKIPAGTADGTKMKLKGRGQIGFDGSKGNLILVIKVDSDGTFRMDSSDVLINVPITISEAVLGSKIEIPTPQGERIRINVPSGCKHGAKLKIKAKGAKKRNGEMGDLVAVLNIEVPNTLNAQQRSAMKAYGSVENKGVRSW